MVLFLLLLCVIALCYCKNAHSYIGKYHAAAGRAAPEQVTCNRVIAASYAVGWFGGPAALQETNVAGLDWRQSRQSRPATGYSERLRRSRTLTA